MPLQKVVVHPGWNPATSENDIALLVLDKPAKTKPVGMASVNYKMPTVDSGYKLLDAAGWGKTESGLGYPQLK